jgi:hydroxyacylglutathione hydrolase
VVQVGLLGKKLSPVALNWNDQITCGPTMKASDLLKRIQANNAPLIIDVRSTSEFRHGHIRGAVNIPVQEFLFRIDRLPKNKNEELLLACEHGPRAVIAKGVLALHGYRNTELLEGHMHAWRKAHMPLEN